jgi:hypothetical protein
MSGQFLGRGIASRRFARRDVHLGTLAQQALGDHATNASGAAGDEGYSALQGVEFVGVHAGSIQ